VRSSGRRGGAGRGGVEQTDGGWVGFEVKLGGDLIDQGAAAPIRLASTRVGTEPSALAVVTGTEYGYRRLMEHGSFPWAAWAPDARLNPG
jgi:hypothetical protein